MGVYYHTHNVIEGTFAVLDGVGGIHGSAYASNLVARALVDIKAPLSHDIIMNTIINQHEELCKGNRTATTLTGLFLYDDLKILVHIGNTRLSVLRNGYLMKYTEDQTEAVQLLSAGYSTEEIPEKCFSSLTSCIGHDPIMIRSLQVQEFNLIPETRILITSDGIHDFLSEEELEKFLQGDLSEEVLYSIARKSRENGSEDDISIVILEC